MTIPALLLLARRAVEQCAHKAEVAMHDTRAREEHPHPVTVVLPALNEEEAVGAQVAALLKDATLRRLGVRQVIVVDNGSTDRTAEVAAAAGALGVREPRRGYGSGCLAGVLAAPPQDIILLMDADGSADRAGAAAVAQVAIVAEG